MRIDGGEKNEGKKTAEAQWCCLLRSRDRMFSAPYAGAAAGRGWMPMLKNHEGLAVAGAGHCREFRGDRIIYMKDRHSRDREGCARGRNAVFAIGSTQGLYGDRPRVARTGSQDILGRPRYGSPSRISDGGPWVTHEISVRDLLCNRSGLSGVSEHLWYATDLSRDEIFISFGMCRSKPISLSVAYRSTMFAAAGQIARR